MVELVGILNVTPDSFSDGGKFFDPDQAIRHAEQMFADGAALIDVGAESTRPLATALTDLEEWERLEPVLRVLIKRFPRKVSLDTYHPETVRRAFNIGPVIVNDVTGMSNPKMVQAVAELQPSFVVVSHLPGRDIQKAHQLAPINRVEQVRRDLLERVETLKDAGIKQDSIILDPGIGFGKTMETNWQLLSFAEQVPGYLVMIGYSKKRFLGEHRMELEANLAAGKIARDSGARYLRVHDVGGHRLLLDEV